MHRRKIAVGMTTVPARRTTTLPDTLASLRRSGFTSLRLFVDGAVRDSETAGCTWRMEFGCEVTLRTGPAVRTFGNFALSLGEVYIREPKADLYLMVQDDVQFCGGLRDYLDRVKLPEDGYCNLYTVPANQRLCPSGLKGWFRSNQLGKGALALLFTREQVKTLFLTRPFVEKPNAVGPRAWSATDGGVVNAMRHNGVREYCHSPSLVQHTGRESTMDHRWLKTPTDFPGEGWDATSLLPRSSAPGEGGT